MPESPSSIHPTQRRPKLQDYLELWTLKLAKLRRRRFGDRQGAEYQQFYEVYFEQRDVEAYTRDRRMVVRRETINEFVHKYAPPNARILDVGCGLGDVLSGITGDYTFFGMDLTQSNVDDARRRLGDAAQITQGSIEDIPFPDASMDVCICLEVLEHIEDDTKGVCEIARVLRPGGVLIGSVPHTYYWADYLRLMGHFRHYTRESFSQLLRQGGLVPEDYLPNYPKWHSRYTRKYVATRAKAMLFGGLFGCRSPYGFKWPWQSAPLLDCVAEKLEPLRQREHALDYATLDTSTWILARKPEG